MDKIYVIKIANFERGNEVPGRFYGTLDEAKAEIDRLFERFMSEDPKWIERLDRNINYGGFQLITRWGNWRSYRICRLDRAGQNSDDLHNELIEGNLAKAGLL